MSRGIQAYSVYACAVFRCRPSVADLESLVKESEALCVDLPHMADIRALLKTAKDWVHKVEAVLVGFVKAYYEQLKNSLRSLYLIVCTI